MNEKNYNLSSSKTYDLKINTDALASSEYAKNYSKYKDNKISENIEIINLDNNLKKRTAEETKEEQLSKLEKEKEELEKEIAKVKKEITDQKWDIGELLFNNDKYNKDIDKLENKLKELEKQLKDINKKITELNKTELEKILDCELVTSCDDEISRIKKEIKNIETKITEKKGELNRKRTAQGRARGLSGISDDDLETIEKEITKLEKELKNKKNELAEAKKNKKATIDYIQEMYYSGLQTNDDFNELSQKTELTEEEAHQVIVMYINLHEKISHLANVNFEKYGSFMTEKKYLDYETVKKIFEDEAWDTCYSENEDWSNIDWDILKKAYDKGFDNIYEVAMQDPKLIECYFSNDSGVWTGGILPRIDEGVYLGNFAHDLNYMTDEEKKTVIYLFNTEGEKAVNEYLEFKQNEFNNREGLLKASEFLEKINSGDYNGVEQFLMTAKKGTGDGLESFFEGIHNFLGGMDGVMSVEQYEAMYIVSFMSDADIDKLNNLTKEEKEKLKELKGLRSNTFLQGTYEISSSIGNMVVPMAASTLVSLVATPAAGKVVGNGLMFISSSGNAAESAYQEGFGYYESIYYGMLSGGSEVTLGAFLGGIPALKVLDDLPGIKGYITNMLSEGGEEALQAILDPYLKAQALGVEPEIDWDEVAKSGLYGLITAGLLNGGKIYEEIDIDVKKLNDTKYLKNLEQKIEEYQNKNTSNQTQNIQQKEQTVQLETNKETISQQDEQQEQQIKNNNPENNITENSTSNINVENQTIEETSTILENYDYTNDSIEKIRAEVDNLNYTKVSIPNYISNYLASNVRKYAYKNTTLFNGLNEQIMANGLYHFTNSADAIIESGYIKASGVNASYGNPKSFFFNGVPDVGAFATNLDSIPLKTTAVKVIPTEEIVNSSKLKLRYTDDMAITYDGNFNLNGMQVEKCYFGLVVENGELVYKQISEESYNNYENTNMAKVLSEYTSNKQNITAIKGNFLKEIAIRNKNAGLVSNESETFNNNNNSNINVERANQTGPYDLSKKIIKSQSDKILLSEFNEIVKKYYPNYSTSDINNLYSELSKNGCTYASMANVIVEQLGSDPTFKEKFGYSLSGNNIDANKIMLDIYCCFNSTIELNVHMYEHYEFDSNIEAAKKLLGKDFSDDSEAIREIIISKDSNYTAEGITANNKLLFKSKTCINKSIIGNYADIANQLFGIDNSQISKNELENLLKKNKYSYEIKYTDAPSKLSGLGQTKINNLEKWINKYFEMNNVNLKLEAGNINSATVEYEELQNTINSKINDGYTIEVSSSLKSEVWMTDGKSWEKPTSETAGHQMNFEGFDKDGNILVCSWGKIYMFPKEFYKKLEFMSLKLYEPNN